MQKEEAKKIQQTASKVNRKKLIKSSQIKSQLRKRKLRKTCLREIKLSKQSKKKGKIIQYGAQTRKSQEQKESVNTDSGKKGLELAVVSQKLYAQLD